jgi:hypothetical protein
VSAPDPIHAHPQSRDTYIDSSVAGNHAPVARGGDASITGVPPQLFWANTLIAGLAIAIALWAIFQASISERETRMLEYYVLEMDAKLIAAGIKKPEESVAKQQERRK